MSLLSAAILTLVPCVLSIQAGQPKGSGMPVAMAFAKGAQRFVWSPNPGTRPVLWAKGQRTFDEALSPDGSALAITLYGPKSKSGSSTRSIAICDGPQLSPRILDAIPGENSYGPVWSPTGSKLAFRHWTGSKWQVAIVHRDGSGFRILDSRDKKTLVIALDLIWTPEETSLWICDGNGMTRVDFEGNQLESLSWSSLGLEVHHGESMFAKSPDGKFLAMLVDDPPAEPREWCDPTFSLWIVHLGTMTKTAVRRRIREAAGLGWVPGTGDLVLEARGPKGQGIYRISPTPNSHWKWSLCVPGGHAPSLAVRPPAQVNP